MAQVHYTAGRRAGIATVSATAGNRTTAIPILLAPENIAAGYSLPASGSAARIALYEAWRRIIQPARLEREGMVGKPIDGYGADNIIGDISTVATVAEPNQVAPGGTVILRITAKDAAGRGVGGQALQVTATPGQVSAVTDQGGGRYTASVTAPAGVSGTLKISVVATKVGVASALELPITGGNWNSVGMATQAAAPADAQKPKKKKAPRTGDGSVRAQGGLAVGSYHYRQEPSVLLGPIYDFPITFGGGQTDAATAPGFALAAAADLPGLEDTVAVRARLRSVLYRVALPEFSEPLADWLTSFDVVGLGKSTFADGQLYAGARIGLGVDDFLVFQQSGNADVRTLDYGPLIVTGLVLGPEFGFTLENNIFGHAAVNFGLANFTDYYRLNLDAQVGYTFTESMYGYLGTDITRRSLAVYMETEGSGDPDQVGIIEDHSNLFTVGVGWEL